MNVNTAQYDRNGVSGQGFFVGIVSDPFGDGDSADYLVISLDGPGASDQPDPSATFVLAMDDLHVNSVAGKWRGDLVTAEALAAIRTTVWAKQAFDRVMA